MKYQYPTFFILILISFLLLFPGCKRDGQSNVNEIAFDSIITSDIFHLDGDSTKPSCSVKIMYVFPSKFESPEILSKIQHELNLLYFNDDAYEVLSPNEAVKQYVADYIVNYQEEAKLKKANEGYLDNNTENYFSYYKTLSNEVKFNQSNILSLQIISTDYKGGFSSSSIFRNVVFDLKTGESLNELDIFLPDYKRTLNKLFIDKILAQNKVKTTDELFDLGYFGIDDFTSNENFLVDGKGLIYIFNEEDVSASSIGEIRLFLPYDELREILKDSSPISSLIGK